MRLTFAHLFLLALLTGCDFITGTELLGGVLLRSPALEVPNEIQVAPRTISAAWLAARDGPTSTAAPEPIEGARVELSFDGGRVLLEEESAGRYSLSSADEPQLTYVERTFYELSADAPTHPLIGARVLAPPILTESALRLTPAPRATTAAPGLPEHPLGAALTVSFLSEDHGRISFIAVLRANPGDPTEPSVVFDTTPKSMEDALNLVLGTSDDAVEIPGTAFGSEGVYAVIVWRGQKQVELIGAPHPASVFVAGTGAMLPLEVARP